MSLPSEPPAPEPSEPAATGSSPQTGTASPDQAATWEAIRDRVIGLGERSIRKSYYPELVQRLGELERFRALLDHSRDAILMLEMPALRIVDVTASACAQFGRSREALLAMSLEDLAPEPAIDAIRASMGQDATADRGCTISTSVRLADDRSLPVEISVRPVRSGDTVYAVAAARDISERLELEGQLLQAAKIESLGRLAGGVAHDFNNLLTAILGNAEVGRSDLADGHPARESIDEIVAAGERAAALVRQLLVFARRQAVAPVPLNLSALVKDSERMLRRLLGEDIDIRIALEPELATIEADPSQMQQLLVNLTVNARDAMPDGGRLVIETANVIIEPGQGGSDAGHRAGRHVELAVTDTGIGMTAETISHIFEPFYTTKELGRGTGLGLATCHGIVRQVGGTISVASEPGGGTTFRILLPATDAAAASLTSIRRGRPTEGTETILVVEDDDSIRRLAVAGLRARGYRVLEAAHGEQALAIAGGHPVDLVVSDVVMPGMSGLELARRLAILLPGVGLILASGHPRIDLRARGDTGDDGGGPRAAYDGEPAAASLEPAVFLAKPYTPERLALRVREVLDARHTQG